LVNFPPITKILDSNVAENQRLREEVIIWQQNLENSQGSLFEAENINATIPGLNDRIRQLEYNTRSNSELISELTNSLDHAESRASIIPELENKHKKLTGEYHASQTMISELQTLIVETEDKLTEAQ
jgi:predicted  nucleic acid-binding Zn-ribbon protein